MYPIISLIMANLCGVGAGILGAMLILDQSADAWVKWVRLYLLFIDVALGVANAAAWLYLNRQPAMVEDRTSDTSTAFTRLD